MIEQMASHKRGAGFESRRNYGKEAFYSDLHTRFLRQSARYLGLDMVTIEGNLIPCKARNY